MRFADSRCTCTEKYEPYHIYTFTGQCIVTGKTYSVDVPAKELHRYRKGAMIQHALASVSAEGREFLMSGMSPEGWNKTFSEAED